MRFGLQATMLANAPAMLGLAAVAEPFILTLYGPQWLPAVPLLQVLCLGGVLMPLHVLNLQVLMALWVTGRGNSYAMSRRQLALRRSWRRSPIGSLNY